MIKEFRIHKILRISLAILFFFWLIFSVREVAYSTMRIDEDTIWSWLGIPCSLIALVSIFRHKLVISENSITKYAFKITTISFNEVVYLGVGYQGDLEIRAGNKKMTITWDLEDFKEIQKFVVEIVRTNTDLIIVGHEETILKLNLQKM
jgi:hypothetical protein